MYTLLQSNGKVTMKEMENSFGGNICRCTGYRSISSAFKTLCSDKDPELIGSYPDFDIEDLQLCIKDGKECKKTCQKHCAITTPLLYELGGSKWYKVSSVDEIMEIFKKNPNASVMLVGGNTSNGVYRRKSNPDIYIDINGAKDLLEYTITEKELILGANMSLTNTVALFYKLGSENKKFSYLTKMADHIDLIANVPVRNVSTIFKNFIKYINSGGF